MLRAPEPSVAANPLSGFIDECCEVDPTSKELKLRGCDVVDLKVEDVARMVSPSTGPTVRQRKTGQPVRFELTEPTRDAVDVYSSQPARSLAIFCLRSSRPRLDIHSAVCAPCV